jgi:hypothetical protein
MTVGRLLCRHVLNLNVIINETAGKMAKEVTADALEQAKGTLAGASKVLTEGEKALERALEEAESVAAALRDIGFSNEAAAGLAQKYSTEGVSAIAKELSQHLEGRLRLDLTAQERKVVENLAKAKKWEEVSCKLAGAIAVVSKAKDVVDRAQTLVKLVDAFTGKEPEEQRLAQIMDVSAAISARSPGIGQMIGFYAEMVKIANASFERWRTDWADQNAKNLHNVETEACDDEPPVRGDKRTFFSRDWDPAGFAGSE